MDQNELGYRTLFGTVFQDPYFFFFSLLYSEKIESLSGRGRLSGSPVFLNAGPEGLRLSFLSMTGTEFGRKSKQITLAEILSLWSLHLPKCPGFSVLFSVKYPSAFSLLLFPPSSLNCQCPWIWTSSQRKQNCLGK